MITDDTCIPSAPLYLIGNFSTIQFYLSGRAYHRILKLARTIAFAVLAYETWHKGPGSLPAATGASRAVVLGSITF